MSRAAVNFLVDAVLLIAFLVLLVTSAIVQTAFPAASQAHGWTLWGATYDQWARAQFYSLASVSVAIGVHLILHWTWVCGFVSTRLSRLIGRTIATNESTRTLYGVITLISLFVLMGSVLWAAQLAVRAPPAVGPAVPRAVR